MFKKTIISLITIFCALSPAADAQPGCTAQGDQTSYGTNNQWIGYVYDNLDFTGYMGYVTAGTPASPNFNTDFGGPYTNYSVAGCVTYTESFSVRYKLRKNFAPGNYEFTISGDDRVRLSIDGGATWLLNGWVYSGYAPLSTEVTLSGDYDLVLEYSEGTSLNTVYFNVEPACSATGTTTTYGTGNVWEGYVYRGIYFNNFKGTVQKGDVSSMNFNENFGGSSVQYPTSSCTVETDFFSVRYRLRHTFTPGSYSFTISGDDKYRFSLDGGATWIIDRWLFDNGNTTRVYTTNLNGAYDMVLEYYEKDGSNDLSFSHAKNVTLPLDLISFSGQHAADGNVLRWRIASADAQPGAFEIESSTNGSEFSKLANLAKMTGQLDYSYTDRYPAGGIIFYRLKIIDELGNISYSKTISIHAATGKTNIYPSMVSNGLLNIQTAVSAGKSVLSLTDINGRQVAQWQFESLPAGSVKQINITNSGNLHGVFIARLLTENKVISTQKLIFP